jgi:hypothetical protein
MGIVNAPNNSISNGNAGSSSSLARHASPVTQPNASLRNGDPGGSASLAKSGSPVNPPNHAFKVGSSKMPQPAAAVQPGKGAIPVDVNDFGQSPGMMAVADEAKRSPRR